MYAFLYGTLFNGEHFIKDKCLLVENGLIQDICSAKNVPLNAKKINLKGHLLAPGFIDLQVNGGGGVLFNDIPNHEELKILANAHLKLGTTSLLPTLITDSLETMQRASKLISQLPQHLGNSILGIHFEGPYLNREKKGIHSELFIRGIDNTELRSLPFIENKINLITIAPENFTAEQIHLLKEKGFFIAAGHTQSSYQEMCAAFKNGVSSVTHVFNACSPMTSREPGVVGASLLDKESYSCFIADGFHVAFPMLEIAFKIKPHKKIIFVSDAMPSLGTALKEFSIRDEKFFVRDGRCTNAQGKLAGSHSSLLDALQNAVNYLKIPQRKALQMCSTNAAEYLKIDHILGRIYPKFAADFVLLNKETNQLEGVFKGGEMIETQR